MARAVEKDHDNAPRGPSLRSADILWQLLLRGHSLWWSQADGRQSWYPVSQRQPKTCRPTLRANPTFWTSGHREGVIEAEWSCEDSELTQELLFIVQQEIEAPVQYRSQRLVARNCRPTSARQRVQSASQIREDLVRTKCCSTRRRELYRKRYSVEMSTDGSNRSAVGLVDREPLMQRNCSLNEQLGSATFEQFLWINSARRWNIQWRKTKTRSPSIFMTSRLVARTIAW